jgi:hypothetical protein
MGVLNLSNAGPEISNTSFPLLKVSSLRASTNQLNRIFGCVLPEGFDFGEPAPAYRLLAVLTKCQMALTDRMISGADVQFGAAIKELKRIWYEDLLQCLETQDQISPSLIEAFFSGFIHRLSHININPLGNISSDGKDQMYFFVSFSIDEVTEDSRTSFQGRNRHQGQTAPMGRRQKTLEGRH